MIPGTSCLATIVAFPPLKPLQHLQPGAIATKRERRRIVTQGGQVPCAERITRGARTAAVIRELI
jgi:hypothetical protein